MYKKMRGYFKEPIKGKILEDWGNRIAILLCFISDRLRSKNIPEIKWSIRHLIAIRNEERYPIVTWVVAKK